MLDNNGHGGTILINLLKVPDTINHDILIAKLHVYGFFKGVIETNRELFN